MYQGVMEDVLRVWGCSVFEYANDDLPPSVATRRRAPSAHAKLHSALAQ